MILLQARSFFQAALSLAPHMYEPHYNWAALADQVRVHHDAPLPLLPPQYLPPPPQYRSLSLLFLDLLIYQPFTLSLIIHKNLLLCSSSSLLTLEFLLGALDYIF